MKDTDITLSHGSAMLQNSLLPHDEPHLKEFRSAHPYVASTYSICVHWGVTAKDGFIPSTKMISGVTINMDVL